jgi:hypothetical protein
MFGKDKNSFSPLKTYPKNLPFNIKIIPSIRQHSPPHCVMNKYLRDATPLFKGKKKE